MSSADSPTPPDKRAAMTRLLDRPNRPATIAESTKASAESRVLRREPQFNLLIFRCGAEWFAVPADFVVHVSKVTTVHTLPHRTNSSFRGLTALSGAVIPVIDFVGLLGIPPAPENMLRKPRMVTVGTAQESWAFEAEDVPGVYAIPRNAVKPLPLTVEQAPRRISSGLITTVQGSTTLVDADRLIREFKNALG
ncbi:MAG: chemotaxis protein CheW [Planctomycetota bacterium]|nr:chemotaxis protein CheW [Planctomycetota bacterium]MDA1263109.1 chemotaxis protein CheW [Planctomycetota bacterium]